MSRTHVNCKKCHAEVAIDLEKCPTCGGELPQGDEHELSAAEARLHKLRKDVADRKAAVAAESERLERELAGTAGASLADGLAKSA